MTNAANLFDQNAWPVVFLSGAEVPALSLVSWHWTFGFYLSLGLLGPL